MKHFIYSRSNRKIVQRLKILARF